MIGWWVGGIVIAIVLAVALPRAWGMLFGCLLLILAVIVPIGLFIVAGMSRGESGLPMWGIFIFMLFTPPGFVLFIISALVGRA